MARFLGDSAVTVAGRPVPSWRAGKAKSLCLYLIAHRDQVLSRDRLYEVLWPGTRPEDGPTSLRVAVHAVRQRLGGAARIECRDGGYLLRADSLWADFDALEAFVSAGEAAVRGDDPVSAAGFFRRAVRLYRGPFLPAEESTWAVDRREWLRSLMLRALYQLRDRALRTAQPWNAVLWCRRVLDIDPYAEPAYQTLVDVHRQLGLVDQAKRWRSRWEHQLDDDMDWTLRPHRPGPALPSLPGVSAAKVGTAPDRPISD